MPNINEEPLLKVFKSNKTILDNPQITELIDSLLMYDPQSRPTALEAMGNDVFKSLLETGNNLPRLLISSYDKQDNQPLPKLFDFDEQGLIKIFN